MHQNPKQQSSGESRVSVYDEVTARVIAEMEQGRLPWVKPWTASGGIGLPRSAATRKTYSGINILILWDAAMMRGYAAQEWMTLRQCNELGGRIRKGERGTTACYADSFIPKAERDRAKEQGEDPNRVPFLKRFTLFNLEQCEGLPAHFAPAPALIPPEQLVPAADDTIAASGATIKEGGDAAMYMQQPDIIRMPPRGSFHTPADYYATILHELGHWTAHPSRLNRDLQHRFGSTAYAREELIAELTSAFLCAGFGIIPQVRHADYLAHWLGILKEDSRAIFHAASQASKASDFLLPGGKRREGGMSLLTNELRAQLINNGAIPGDYVPQVKFFNPTGAATWLISEAMPEEPDILFGLCDLGMGEPELGSVRLSELEAVKVAFGLGIERDPLFVGRYPISVYAEAARHQAAITTIPSLLEAAAARIARQRGRNSGHDE